MRRRTFTTALLASFAAPGLAAAQTTNPPRAGGQNPAPNAAPQTILIEPNNALERAFMAATEENATEVQRTAFRRLFLTSNVVLLVNTQAANAPPAQIPLPNGAEACLIFTSAERAQQAMQRQAPLVTLTGSEALTRVRGTNVIVNMNLRPRLFLDAEGVDGFLAAGAPENAAPGVVAPGVRAPN